ncbi:sensor histidine kinase [Streptohalobacillus salinus]|nr:sensor histidine kinase [Streptohalobacillus salinus]
MSELKETLQGWIERNSLFLKVFLVTLVSVILVAAAISYSTIRLSTTYFLDSFSLTNSRITSEVKHRFENFTTAVVTAVREVENSGTIKRVLSMEEMDSLLMAGAYFDVATEVERIYSHIQPENANLMVAGVGSQLYNMNYSYWPITHEALLDLEITETLSAEPDKIHYKIINRDNNAPLVVAGKALTERLGDAIYGFVYIPIREQELKRFYQGYTTAENSVLLLDQSGQVISSSNERWLGEAQPALLAEINQGLSGETGNASVTFERNNYIYIAEYIPGFNMYLVNVIDQQAISDHVINTDTLFWIILAIIGLSSGMSWLITRRITRSLTRLVRQISKLNRHNFSKRLKEEGGYESREIARAFNYTLDELDHYVKVVVDSQKRQRDAELRALQHQINPHFLYNTLATVKFMVAKGEGERAIDTIHALISLLQSSLTDVGETVPVKQELEHMKYYVRINQARYGDRIKVNYFVAPDCYDYRLPKLVLQPFIENAFFHGFNEKKTGFIQILIHQENEQLICEVIDDGDGMTITKEHFPYVVKQKRQMFSGIGMRNVHERIQLLYGDPYGVSVESEKGAGTKVTVTLPLVKAIREEETEE